MQYNQEEFDEILNIFTAESSEIIQKINSRFMELEQAPEDKTPLKELLQLAHSLKGGARMIGFNSIQDLLHKLEDILSFWKNNAVDVKFFPVIYEVCDLLEELASKSAEQKSDYKDQRVLLLLNKLDNYTASETSGGENSAEIKQVSETDKIIIDKAVDVNALLLEMLFITDKNSAEIDFENTKEVLKEDIEQLAEIFKSKNCSAVQNKISELINILNNVSNHDSIIYIKEQIKELEKIVYGVYREFNISPGRASASREETCSDSAETGPASLQNTGNIETAPKECHAELYSASLQNAGSGDFNVKECIKNIMSGLQRIKQDKKSAADIISRLQKVKNASEISDESRILQIIEKIIKILERYISNETPLDNSCYMVLLQGVFLIDRLLNSDGNDYEPSFKSIINRLSLAEDMLKAPLKHHLENEPPAADKTEERINIQNSGLMPVFNPANTSEIKTLRVDTSKLDRLIAQTGELLINSIKTSEHLAMLSKINKKLIKWNGAGKKIITYLKYLEKKGFFILEQDESVSLFYRRMQQFFNENAEMINEINNDLANLYNIVSEDDNKLHQTAASIESISKDIRVLPLAALFHSFPRMMRDIAKENNKKIEFIISGSDTAVDKKIIEEIKMPLVHILRNAVSHGIECPKERIRNGKKETGTVRLTSKQEENNVIITVEDDGYGVNIDKVKEKALSKGLLTAEEVSHIESKQLFKVLFLPGFSTEESVNEISGRGIGLDIVKTKINNLNGTINIDSVINQGCRVTIRLPLSMSTIKTFIVQAAGQKYALPVNAVKYAANISRDKIFINNGVKSIIYDNHSVPVFSFSKVLCGADKGENEKNRDILTAVILESSDKQAAFVIDKLLGGQEVFQKKLAPPVIKLRNISGFTMLPAGEICLIINPHELVKNACGGENE